MYRALSSSKNASHFLRSVTLALVVGLVFSLVEEAWAVSASAESSFQTSKVSKKKISRKKMSRAKSKQGALKKSGRSLAQDDGGSGDDLAGDLDAELDSSLDADLETDLGSESETVTAEAEEPSIATGEEVQILDIAYDSKKDGGTVIIQTTGPATYRTREVPAQNQVVIELANTRLPERLKRPFNTKDFRQSIVSLNAYQEAGSSTARVVLQFRQPRSVSVKQNGQKLTVVAGNPTGAQATPVAQNSKSDDFGDDDLSDLDASSASDLEVSAESSSSIKKATPLSTTDEFSVLDRSSGSGGTGRILPSSTLEQERRGEVRFYGRPISIEVRDTPVRDVITLIADQSGANIIMSDDVTGSITIKLRQVPWDQALSIIMRTRGLGYVRQGGVLRVAPVRQLQAEAEEARRIIEAQEATQPLRVRVIPVSFASVALLATQIRNTLQAATAPIATAGAPPAAGGRGKIEADPRSSTLIVTDTDDNIRRIEQLVKALDTPPLQVMIEGKIVEAREEAQRRLGVNWGYAGQDLGFAGGTLSHTAVINPALGASNTNLDLRLGTLDFIGDLSARLALFETESIAKIISSPRVITMNAQKATIEQSVSIAVRSQTLTPGQPPVTTVTYKTIPTILDVTPQITPGGDVLMQIAFRREFQSGGASGDTVPIESRDVKTNVMVKNGQTTVIGGIYQADQTETEAGTPLLRKIPVLGWLFKSVEKTSLRNELLVFITPRILNADRTLPKANAVQ